MRRLIIALPACLFFLSCKHEVAIVSKAEVPYECDTSISFKNKVQQLFINDCSYSGCHDGNDLPYLGDYTIISAAIEQIQTAIENGSMPPVPLKDSDKNEILCWISSGYKNN